MTEKVFLSLVGGRSAIPTILGSLQFLEQFDRIKFLLCEHPNNQYKEFQENTLRILKKKKDSLRCEDYDVKTVDGNNFKNVYESVSELCNGNINLKFVNVTSAPQEMAFATYLYVYEKNKDVIVFSVNTQKSQITPLVLKDDPILIHKLAILTVEDYISACGLEVFQQKFNIGDLSCNEEQAKNIVDFFVDEISTTHELLSVLRSKQSIKPPQTISIPASKFPRKISNKKISEFFNILQENNLLTNFVFNNKIYSFHIQNQKDHTFLCGDWLEYYVYIRAKEVGFDSTEMSIELKDFKGEIDIFCVNGANALIGECKTGKYDSNDLSTLESKAIKLGGNYCVKLFITSEQNISEKFANQSRNKKIVVISGNELKGITEILKKEMNKPTFPRN